MADPIPLHVNGAERRITAPAGLSLLSALRDQLDLTGAKYSCGEGQCGACTVLIDGKPVRSCLVPAASAAGKRIETVEGLERNGVLHPLQQAFLDKAAFQCGYCTPGFLMASVALLRRRPNPTPTQIRSELNGHLCRCGAYPRIVEAVRIAASRKR
ncbi:MAG: (2Fe-2S)-binding protein [Bryobacterales bacterium]|nr:(2Fe-2S)-binding protein [Bryobacterales bacterium]